MRVAHPASQPRRGEAVARIIVIGGGLAGLATSLFLGRRGHQVTLLEADSSPPSTSNADLAFAEWPRRGAGQARQTHMFLGLSSAEMARGCPAVLDNLRQGGALVIDDASLVDRDGTPAPIVAARRFAYELALRRAINEQAAITIRSDAMVSGLLAARGDPPCIHGVYLAQGDQIEADLIIDCAGRRSMAHRWLPQAGSRSLPEQRQACGFSYLTRWYRLRKAERFPDVVHPVSVRLPYMTVLAAPADRGWFSVTLTLSEKDPLRHRLRDGDCFDRVAQAVPASAAFVERGVAQTAPLPFGNIANQRRSLLDDKGPLVRGYLLVGDSSMHTNPTLGRGTSLAFAQARHLADSLADSDPSSADLVLREEKWARERLTIWFDTQVTADAAFAERLDRFVSGKPSIEPDEAARTRGALFAAARDDPAVARQFRKLANLLLTPAELIADPVVQHALAERLAGNGPWPEFVDLLPRTEFDRLLA